MRKIDTVLFDFDGTIMDTNNVILMSWQHTFKTLENREEKEEILTATFGEPLEITMARFFPNVPLEESIEIYRSYQRDNFKGLITMFPGVEELLAEIKNRGYKTGLVTSRLKKTTLQGLEKYGIREYFDAIVTPEDTDKHKPDPTPVLVALKKLDSKPENTVMVGDTLFDIKCARNAGVSPVLVSWSLAMKPLLESAAQSCVEEVFGDDAPEYIINEPEELLGII